MKDFIEYIIKRIVTHPDEVIIEEEELTSSESSLKQLKINIKVNTDDIPLVIGKKGRTIKAIRNIAKIKAVKENLYIDINIS
jgi:uncharacterized protein